MQHNILRESNVTKIYLIYIDNGSRKKVQVKLRFMDSKECYFASSASINFEKPKKRIPAELKVYTTDGVYQAKITLFDTNVSLNEVMYEVSIPGKWDFSQLRASSRKQVELPIQIQFNDGFTIEAITYDLSLGGISFVSDKTFSGIYKKISGKLTLKLPKETIINFPNGVLMVETKFVREAEHGNFGETLYSFKFIGMKLEDEEILKNFLLRLN